MIGDWTKFGSRRSQYLKETGRRRRRRPGPPNDIIELLALSGRWVLVFLGILYAAGLAYPPIDAR